MTYELTLNPAQLQAILPAAVVFDVRHQLTDTEWGRKSYAAGHVPGAVHLHLDADLSSVPTGSNGRHPLPDAAAFAARLGALGVGADTQVVVYDQNNGTMAARLWWMLRHWLGHRAVAVLDGGWDAWVAAGAPQSTEVPQRAPARFDARVAADVTVDAAGVLANIGAAAFTVVDARAPERYEGRVEPLDPVGGHIPGALNRPCGQNCDAQGRFKSAEQLRAEWTGVLGQRRASAVVHQCGSGVTACHNVLAMELAGLGASRVYPGSWSEWSADATRPVAKGPQP